MDKKQLIEAVAFHLQRLDSNHATVCGMDIIDAVRECAIALGIEANVGGVRCKNSNSSIIQLNRENYG